METNPEAGSARDQLWAELGKICQGPVMLAASMSRFTTLRVGGPAEALVCPSSPLEVARVMKWAKRRGVAVSVIGAGSNLLVRDGGIRGVVMRIGPPMERWDATEDSGRIHLKAQAGLPLPRLLGQAVRRGWGGLGFLVGIPGSLGGAVAMNAGTSEGCMGDLVEEVTWVDDSGGIVTRGRVDLDFSYRRLHCPHGVAIVEACLAFAPKDPREVWEELRQRMILRRRTQPYGIPSAGSVFKNPPGDHAGRIIEELGLKGLRRGGAMISALHANFIVNAGGARAGDVLALIDEVRQQVVSSFGIHLELEIQVLGEDG